MGGDERSRRTISGAVARTTASFSSKVWGEAAGRGVRKSGIARLGPLMKRSEAARRSDQRQEEGHVDAVTMR